ncbi:MAG TPA: hypothetical protein VGA29_07595 [Ignavibacteriaceae bacterium]
MNNKAQMAQMNVGLIIVAFVGVIAALAMFSGAILGNIGLVTNLQHYNSTAGNAIVTPTQGEIQTLTGKAVTNFNVVNASGTGVVAANYTTADNQIIDGTLVATWNCSGEQCVNPLNLTYDYQDVGYITNAGGRSLAALIAIFAALAIGVVALVPALRSGLLEQFGR